MNLEKADVLPIKDGVMDLTGIDTPADAAPVSEGPVLDLTGVELSNLVQKVDVKRTEEKPLDMVEGEVVK